MLVVRAFESLVTTRRVLEALDQRSPRGIGGLWGGSKALLVYTLQRHWSGPILLLTADDDESIALEGDILAFRPNGSVQRAPSTLVTEIYDLDDEVVQATRSERIRCLTHLHDLPAPGTRQDP